MGVVVHGDDFTALGCKEELNTYNEGLRNASGIKVRGRLGGGPGDDKQLRILNRIVSITENSLTYEADPRLSDSLARAFGREACISRTNPGVKYYQDIDAGVGSTRARMRPTP